MISHHRFTKQPDLSECSRDYLEALVERLESDQAAGIAINQAVLEQARLAITTAPATFLLHGVD
jgi:hypothetical protein